jgi:Protein of unknown function (DUF3767)
MSTSDPSENAVTSPDQIETARWTRHLPEAFGIRAAVQRSKYRWCVRESGMWGIATGSAMAMHRFRMQSRTSLVVNAGFSTFFLVYLGSYYFCVKRRDYKELMIEQMMKLNAFEHALQMPEPVPLDENHPFVEPPASTYDDSKAVAPKQYVAHLPERKEWQPPLPSQDASNVFRPADK